MSVKKKVSRQPLWYRAIHDPDAKAWIAQHSAEFPANSFLPAPIAFHESRNLHQRFVADVVRIAVDHLEPELKLVGQLWLRMHPKEVATKLKMPRKALYMSIRRMKNASFRYWKRNRADGLLCRAGSADLDTTPERIATRAYRFELMDKLRTVYLVSRDDEQLWCDEQGEQFTTEIEDILFDLAEHRGEFEVLHVEEA